MYKSLRMAHEKLLMCETNLHRYGLYSAIPLTFSNVDGKVYSAFIFCRLFHNCIFNVCGKSIMKVFQLLAQVEKTSVFVSFYKKHLTCIDNWVSTSISLPANNDKNMKYDIVRIVTQGIV